MGQTGFRTSGSEYGIAIAMAGDQVFPHLSIKPSGGYLVWQDNITDGDGWGISAMRLDSTFSPSFSSFRVNQNGIGDQEQAQVTLLSGGGAAFVWEGGTRGAHHIWARFLSASGTWLTGDVLVNSATNTWQRNPVIATLANSNLVVAWGSYNQYSANALQDVFAQILSPTGQKVGSEFLVNQFTAYNQRTPAVTGLSDGRFVVTWVSEQQTFDRSVDIFARVFGSSGAPVGAEFQVNTGTNVCADPTIASVSGTGFVLAWCEKDTVTRANGWDVFARPYSLAVTGGVVSVINTYLRGDQYAPRIAALPAGYFLTWSSVGQDGSEGGVFGQFLNATGASTGGETRVNTTTASQQIHPVVASDGVATLVTAWSSFTGSANGMDVYAQRYLSTAAALPTPATPYVTALSSSNMTVSWPPVTGLSVADYEVYADGAVAPTAVVTNDWWTMTGLATSSTHYFQFDYVLGDGRRSPLSPFATNTTYGSYTWGGIPFEWMSYYYGNDLSLWPQPSADSDHDGETTVQEFLAGTNPTNAASALRMNLQSSIQGLYLNWQTQPGLIYQLQSATDLNNPAWANVGNPRFAPGTVDSIYVGGNKTTFYRVIRLR